MTAEYITRLARFCVPFPPPFFCFFLSSIYTSLDRCSVVSPEQVTVWLRQPSRCQPCVSCSILFAWTGLAISCRNTASGRGTASHGAPDLLHRSNSKMARRKQLSNGVGRCEDGKLWCIVSACGAVQRYSPRQFIFV